MIFFFFDSNTHSNTSKPNKYCIQIIWFLSKTTPRIRVKKKLNFIAFACQIPKRCFFFDFLRFSNLLTEDNDDDEKKKKQHIYFWSIFFFCFFTTQGDIKFASILSWFDSALRSKSRNTQKKNFNMEKNRTSIGNKAIEMF